MFLRFPDIIPGYDKTSILAFDNIPYATFILEKEEGHKNVFLTAHTLLFVLQGEKLVHIGDDIVRVGPHAAVFLKRGVYTMSEFIPAGDRFEALLIFIPDCFLEKFMLNNPVGQIEKNNLPYYRLAGHTLLDSFTVQYKDYFGQRVSNLQYILDIKLHELFLLLTSSPENKTFSHFIHSLAPGPGLDLDLILRQFLFHPLTIPELAKLSGRSVASFKRDVEERYGFSPRQWINREKIHQARMLLLNSRKTVSEIAYDCGYENVSHFIRLFRKEFGDTPSGIRKENAMI